MFLLATSWKQRWMMRYRLRAALWQSLRRISRPFPLPQTTDRRWRRSAGALLLCGDGRPPRRRLRGPIHDTPRFAFTLLLMIIVMNHRGCLACEGLFSRWTRQRLQSSVGTDDTPRDSTLTRQSSNASSLVKKRYPHVHRLFGFDAQFWFFAGLRFFSAFQEWEEKPEQENHTEQPKKKAENRKRVHEEKTRLAHLQVPMLDEAVSVS